MFIVKQPSEGFFKKDVLRNFAKFTRKHLPQNLLVFSCQFCGICKNTFFAEQHRTTDSHYSSINSIKGSIGKRNCKLWYTNYQVSEAVFRRPQLGVLKIFLKFHRNLRFQHRCFPVKFAKFLRTSFFKEF